MGIMPSSEHRLLDSQEGKVMRASGRLVKLRHLGKRNHMGPMAHGHNKGLGKPFVKNNSCVFLRMCLYSEAHETQNPSD